MAVEGDGGGGSGGGGGGAGGGGGGDIGAILQYLNYLSIGNDGDYTGNAGYGGDNTGPAGSTVPAPDDDRAAALVDATILLSWRSDGRQATGGRPSQEVEPYSGGEMAAGSLFHFVADNVDVYSGRPAGRDHPDPFTGLPAADAFFDAGPSPRASLLSSPYLLASNGWQEVIVNDDPGATYRVRGDSDVVQRTTAAYSEVFHAEGGDAAVLFAPDRMTVQTVERISRDMQTMGRTDFYLKYADRLDASTLDQLASSMPKQPFTFPEADKTTYIDSAGRIGTADSLAAQDLAAGIAGVSPSTALGGAYSLGAVALGGDAREAARMGKLGDAWSPVFTMAAAVPAVLALKQPALAPPPWQPKTDFGAGKVRLTILNPDFTSPKTVEEAFQGATLRVANRLQANPALNANYLSPGQNRLASFGPWAQKIVLGNAVERALAQGSAPTGLLVHTGDIRPFPLGGPDFLGAAGTPYAGLRFQVTTQLQWGAHWENDAPGTVYGLYR